jgi:DNA-binding MarR family transcriptional regulator
MKAFARRADPETSHEAAASVESALPQLEAIVLAVIRRSRQQGQTLDQLIDATGIDKVTLSPRLRPLCAKGFVVEMGKRPGKSGRSQTVWVAVEFARGS